MRTRALALMGSLALVPAAAGSTPDARIAFTQPEGARNVVALYDADGSNGQAVGIGDSPSWSPDGTRLAFASRADSGAPGEIAVVTADGAVTRRLTFDAGPDVSNTSPRWSPSGAWLAFFKATRGIPQVWVISPAGADAHALTTDSGQKFSLQWSPDGSRLLWVSDGVITIWPADGGPLLKFGSFARDPVFSPDGTKIAFTNGQLLVVNADGTGLHTVTSMFAAQPSWSPDGSHLAFVGTRLFPQFGSRYGPASRADLFTVSAEGTDIRRLTGPARDDVLYGYPAGSAPTWWPDGSRLFFQDARDSLGTTTYQVNLDGTCEGKFLQGGPRVVSAAWRPGSAPALGRLHCVDLRVVASAENDVAAIGKRDTLHFSIGNDGNERAIGASITFTASPGAIVEPNIPCHELVCTLPPIEPGGSFDVAVTLRSFEPDTTARVSGVVDAVGDSDISTNTAQVPVQVLRCTVVGTIGPDYLYGTPRADRICARPGADHIFAGAGNDYIDAGNGDDVIYPGPGRDTVIASGGNDVVYARDGQRDYIDCGSEHDIAVVDRLDVVHRCEVVARSKR